MSRDDFDFINLTENLEKNTEEMIQKVQIEREQSSGNYGEPPRRREEPLYKEPMRRQEGAGYQEQLRGENSSYTETSRRQQDSGYEERPKRRETSAYGSGSSGVRGKGREGNRGKRSREDDMASGRDQRGGRRKPSRAEKKLKRKLIKIAVILLVLFGVVYAMVNSVVSKTNYEKLDTDYVRPSDVETVKGVKNILLIGTDARSTDEDGRSDSMIILSINSKNNRIVMTSILRDSYVEIPGHGSNRINAAYSYGQEALLIQTIEQNFKIPIDAYAKVDFFSFIDIVDAVGGVEIDVSDEEMKWVNAYLNETNELLGKEFGDGYLTQSGTQTLTGKQALSYARIRYIGTDFQRTERQREILTAVMDKAKTMGPSGVTKIMNTVLPKITTNIPDSELTMMTMKAVMYMGYDMEQIHLPLDGTWENATISGMQVLKIDFEANIAGFKEAVYGEKSESETASDASTEQ